MVRKLTIIMLLLMLALFSLLMAGPASALASDGPVNYCADLGAITGYLNALNPILEEDGNIRAVWNDWINSDEQDQTSPQATPKIYAEFSRRWGALGAKLGQMTVPAEAAGIASNYAAYVDRWQRAVEELRRYEETGDEAYLEQGDGHIMEGEDLKLQIIDGIEHLQDQIQACPH